MAAANDGEEQEEDSRRRPRLFARPVGPATGRPQRRRDSQRRRAVQPLRSGRRRLGHGRWLSPSPRRSRSGRDSLGRGTAAGPACCRGLPTPGGRGGNIAKLAARDVFRWGGWLQEEEELLSWICVPKKK
mmetsp:Transcript_33974/g.68577  ORF Transcript_33974/g.68577 Transcript_33974/m.68577 type:complete len:130 (-) Transcript_33974:39-428(-)